MTEQSRSLRILDHGRSGAPGEMHFGQIWEMRDGRFKRMTMYGNVEQARRAAGLMT